MPQVVSPSGRGCTTPSIISQSDKTGRRSYKMMRSLEAQNLKIKKEPVWPPPCETALLEGLRAYRPVSKSGQPLRRFVKRNVFISAYIYQKTGKRRTAKQVGSRLQQISESSRDEELKRLITNRELLPEQMYSDVDSSLSSEPSTPSVLVPSSGHNIVHFDPVKSLTSAISSDQSSDVVDIASGHSFGVDSSLELDESSYDDPSVGSISLLMELLSLEVPVGSTAQFGLDADITDHGINCILTFGAQDQVHPTFTARKLSDIPFYSLFTQIPHLSIISPFLSPHKAYFGTFGVYLDSTKLVHSEIANLTIELAPVDCLPYSFVWRTPIIPGYWTELISSPSLDRFTIVLDVSELPSGRTACMNARSTFSVAFNLKSMPPPNSIIPSTPAFEETALVLPDAATPSSNSSPLDDMTLTTLYNNDLDYSRMRAWLETSSAYQDHECVVEQPSDRHGYESFENRNFPC